MQLDEITLAGSALLVLALVAFTLLGEPAPMSALDLEFALAGGSQ